MAEKEFKQRGIATFKSMQVATSKVVTLTFKLRYDEMITSINLLQGLNNDITIHARVSGRKAVNLGMFTIGAINFDKDGNAIVPFKSRIESVNMNNISEVLTAEQDDIIQLQFLAVLELPDNGEE